MLVLKVFFLIGFRRTTRQKMSTMMFFSFTYFARKINNFAPILQTKSSSNDEMGCASDEIYSINNEMMIHSIFLSIIIWPFNIFT